MFIGIQPLHGIGAVALLLYTEIQFEFVAVPTLSVLLNPHLNAECLMFESAWTPLLSALFIAHLPRQLTSFSKNLVKCSRSCVPKPGMKHWSAEISIALVMITYPSMRRWLPCWTNSIWSNMSTGQPGITIYWTWWLPRAVPSTVDMIQIHDAGMLSDHRFVTCFLPVTKMKPRKVEYTLMRESNLFTNPMDSYAEQFRSVVGVVLDSVAPLQTKFKQRGRNQIVGWLQKLLTLSVSDVT